MVTLVVGSTGAGKTTYAQKLSSEISAVTYSIDNWMKDLFGPDMPSDPEPQWFYDNQKWYVERIGRCEALIKKIVLDRAVNGQRSLLDLGFTTKQHRLQFIEFFKKNGVDVVTHFLDVPVETRKFRVEERNRLKGKTFVMTVDEGLFDYMESIFEPPTECEGAELFVINGGHS